MILTNEIRSAEERGLNRKRLLEATQIDGYTFSHKVECWGEFSEKESRAILNVIGRFERECRMLQRAQADNALKQLFRNQTNG